MNRSHRSTSPFTQQRNFLGQIKEVSPSPMKPQEIQDNQILDDEFVNIMLDIEKKYTILSKHERIRIEQWTKKLCSVTSNKIWKKNRNLYAQELLNMVNVSQLLEPFTRMPPEGALPKFNKYEIEKPRKLDVSKEELFSQNTFDLKQRSTQSHHVQSSNNIHRIIEQNNNHINISVPQVRNQSHSQSSMLNSQFHQQQPQQYYGIGNYGQYDDEYSKQNQQQSIQINLKKSGILSRGGSPRNSPKNSPPGSPQYFDEIIRESRAPSVVRESRAASVSRKQAEDNQTITQQTDKIKNLSMQLQIAESKYSEQVAIYQEDVKNIEITHQRQLNECQITIQQLNQNLNETKEENNLLTNQVKKLRNILSNIGIQIIHIKDNLPSSQTQQLEEIIKQLSELNIEAFGKTQSDLIIQYNNYMNDTNEQYSAPQSILYNDGSNKLAYPLNSSIVNKKQMSPNVRSQMQYENDYSKGFYGLNSSNSLANMNQNYDLTQSNRSKNQNNLSGQNQINNYYNQQSSQNNISSTKSNRPNTVLSNKNSIGQPNKYFPSANQLQNNQLKKQQRENAQDQQHGVQQYQNQQALPIPNQSQQAAASNQYNVSPQQVQISNRYEQQQQQKSIQQQGKFNDPMPITYKNEKDTQEFLNYLDNFQKKTEKINNETSQFLKVNDKYSPQKTKK